ncbi:MAG: TIGR03808 family TAT-translocated repetitive protein [Rhodobacteraceae bacterium]|nr:TIGR03808 family TAT-translocated repetitive protein [Paracoccaceae bacterium]
MLNRRHFCLTALAFATPLHAESTLSAANLGLIPNTGTDQSAALTAALKAAADQGRALYLPAGTYHVANVPLPPNTALFGRGAPPVLQLASGQNILTAEKARNISLSGLHLRGTGGKDFDSFTGLFHAEDCANLDITDCTFTNAATQGINLNASSGHITENQISGIYGAGIASLNATGLWITGNEIDTCENLGVYIARDEAGYDGTIITRNRIRNIGFAEGGNGQNGNAINAFRAGNVVISNNTLSDCAFSAVRLNATRDCQITGNNCRRLEEVAIFSEFGFSGSVISGNIIDEAAQGIAITNFDSQGRLAVCSNNIIRNIWQSSPTNPDTTPVGIGAEADTLVSGNVIENVPGVGIALGWGPYLRDVSATGNITRNCDIGIGVSLVQGAGAALINNNLIQVGKSQIAIAGTLWDEIAVPDLIKNASRYPQLTLIGNHISQ